MLLKKLLPVCYAIIGLSLAACCRLTEAPLCGEFDGIKTALDRDNVVSLFIAHGMSGFSEGDPEAMIYSVVNTLGLCPDGEECVRLIERGDSPSKMYGCLSRQDYQGTSCPYKLRIYVLDWREATWREKAPVRWIDEGWKTQCRRVKMIRRLKEDIMNSGLGDAALYLGDFKRELQYPFEQALRWIYADSKLSNHEIVFVGFSMGSQILLDTLDSMGGFDIGARNDLFAKQVRDAFIEQINAFFMLSNQLPIFHLSETDPASEKYVFNDGRECDAGACCDPSTPLDELRKGDWDWESTSLGNFIKDKRTLVPDFQIVAVSDPNDLLSYTMNYYCYPGENGDSLNAFANVEVRNVTMSYFGLVNAAKAHTHYGRNCRVLSLIIHGLGR